MQNYSSKFKIDIKQRVYQYSLKVIKFISSLPNTKIFWVLSDQLLRCGTSIGANIIEAKSSSSKREFIKYYEIALKSSNEAKYWLCLFRDSNLNGVDKASINELLQETVEISNILGSSLLTLKGKKKF